ncbi:MAG: NAD-dependent epimerase [Candidatus Rokubacteria bacterium 13_1_40CM_68_15]|nr:MAG: NAD-dependent epimerase [Candidatus Rokubacteria bacterium 13_1_40CM_68_15]
MSGLDGASVLITGGAGLIGSHIADRCVDAGVREIVVLDNLTRGRVDNLALASARGQVTLFEGDIRDKSLVAEATEGIDVVFHQAAIRITHCAEAPRECLEVLIDGTFNVLEAAVQAKVARVIYASSASIYGQADAFPTPETQHPYHNDTLYGGAKVAGEQMLRAFHQMYGLDGVALRYFNVYGPRMDVYGVDTEVMIRWIDAIEGGRRPQIFGDGSQSMDFVFVDDVARANVLAAQASCTNEAINVASGTETTLRELLDTLLDVMAAELEPEFKPERKVNAVRRRLAATDKAERLLGFRAEVGLAEGLRRLVARKRSGAGALVAAEAHS